MIVEDSNYLTTIFRSSTTQQITDYATLYKYDNLVSTIIDTFPDTAYSTGFKIISDSEEYYSTILNNLRVWEQFKTASKWSRLHGLSCILMVASGDISKPLKESQSIQQLKIYSLSPDIDITTQTIKIGTDDVHISRLIFFKGKEVLTDASGEVKASYCSILDGLIDVLMKYREIPSLALKLIKTSNQVVLATKGLSAGIRNDILTGATVKRQEIQSRLNSLNEGRSLQELMLIDLENEQLDKTALNLSGVDRQVEVLENQLASRSGYPKHILFGDSQMSSLGSGQIAQLIQRMLWASQVSNWIDNNWTEGLEKITNQIKNSLELKNFEINIPLSLVLSEQEISEINKLQMEVLEKLLAVYPMEYQQIKEYIEQHFNSVNLPDITNNRPRNVTLQPETVTVPIEKKDSITDDLNQLTVITTEVVDEVMTKIGEQS